jgi:hypothetical protein
MKTNTKVGRQTKNENLQRETETGHEGWEQRRRTIPKIDTNIWTLISCTWTDKF